MNSLYLIGYPGVGKTTLLATILETLPQFVVTEPGTLKHVKYWPSNEDFNGIQLGVPREGGFGGTDSLPLNAITAMERWLSQSPPDWLVAEGDRLANDRFFSFLSSMGTLTVCHLVCPPEVLVDRLQKRGSGQDPRWLAGRKTKTDTLAMRYGAIRLTTHFTTHSEMASAIPWLSNHKVIQALQEGLCG